MARRRRRQRNGFRGIERSIEVGARAPVLLSLGTGLATQVQAQARAPTAAGITGGVLTGTLGVVATKSLDVAFKKRRR